jgi:hypothetical protein
MLKQVVISAAVITMLSSLTLLAANSLGGRWDTEIRLDATTPSFESLQSVLNLDYSWSSLTVTSDSELQLFGFLWQEFAVHGSLGAFQVQGNLLFGPSTGDYLYMQMIASMELAGCEIGAYFAQLSDAVLGGAADGLAVRISGSFGDLNVVSTTELGARVRDDDFSGITIVHTASGLYRTYDTNPLVPGQGFTGQEITLSGLTFGCADDIKASVYFTCDGFESLSFEVAGIRTNLPWLCLDATLTFQLQTKSLVLVPHLSLGQLACLNVYAGFVTGAGDNAPIGGISLYGLELSCTLGSVTFRDLSVLDPSRYAITTPAYGSVIESIVDAIDQGHEYYPDYWEMLLIDIPLTSCCGGSSHAVIYTYFSQGSSSLFGWAMTSIEASVAFTERLEMRGGMEISAVGDKYLTIGLRYDW